MKIFCARVSVSGLVSSNGGLSLSLSLSLSSFSMFHVLACQYLAWLSRVMKRKSLFLEGTVSFSVLAMIPMKEGTKMLMSYEWGDNAIIESLLLSMPLSRILSMTFSRVLSIFSPSLVAYVFLSLLNVFTSHCHCLVSLMCLEDDAYPMPFVCWKTIQTRSGWRTSKAITGSLSRQMERLSLEPLDYPNRNQWCSLLHSWTPNAAPSR